MIKKHHVITTLAFMIILLASAAGFILRNGKAASLDDESASPQIEETIRRASVITTPAMQMDFRDELSLSGEVEAHNYALVSARIPGTLDAIFVDEGMWLEAGKTRLFQTDSLKLTKSVEIARGQLAVAECTVREKQASLEIVQADHHKAELDYHRFRRLFEEGEVVSRDAFEEKESNFLQLKASLKHAQALVELSEREKDQSASQLAIAQKDLRDSVVLAPISGVVSQRYREPGEMAAVGTAILKIEDPSLLEVSAYLPEEYYGRVEVNRTRMRARVSGETLEALPVIYKSPTVDSTLRTFEVKCLVKAPPTGVVPGAIAEITIVFNHAEGLGVPAGAVQQRGDRSVIFVLDGDKARMLPVRTGRETDGWVEILDGSLEKDVAVITVGQYFINEGSSVSIVKESR